MRFRNLPMIAAAILLLAGFSFVVSSSAEQQSTHPAAKTQTSSRRLAHHKKARHARVRGQKAIDGDRTRQIQEALIREHYLKGDPTGKWDASTQAAMHRYQSDQGWQSKTIPDSRALIRLGLGPDNDHLLNPESAMTTQTIRPTSSAARSSARQSAAPAGSSMP